MLIIELVISDELDFILYRDENSINYIKVRDLSGTPYFRLETTSIEEAIQILSKKIETSKNEIYIYNKKNIFHWSVDKRLTNLLYYYPDYWFSQWKNNKIEIKENYENIVNLASHSRKLNLLSLDFIVTCDSSYIINHNEVLKACQILSTQLIKEDTIIYKNFNPYTTTGRLHDITGNTVAMKKNDREKVMYEGVKIEVDIDGFHLRIIDELLNLNMFPKNKKAIEKLYDEMSIKIERAEFKKMVYKELYSENFNIDHLFFKQVKKKYKQLKGALSTTRLFNYVIQSYEVLEMSKIINNIPLDTYYDITFYLYDGLIIDVKKDKVKDILNFFKSQKYPFKISLLNKQFFVY